MKKRTAFIGAILSLIPLGQPLLIRNGLFLTSSAILIAASENAYARDASYYFDRAFNKAEKGNHKGAISDYTKSIELNPYDGSAFKNRGISKELIGDLEGACSDWRQTVSFSSNDAAAKWVREEC